MNILWGIFGIATVLGLAFLLSPKKKSIRLRPVFGGLGIQLVFALIVLKWDLGKQGLEQLAFGVQKVIDFTQAGTSFMFGPLVGNGEEGFGFIFAFRVLPIIVFFSSLVSVLYYLKIMQFFVKIIGGGLAKLLGTSDPESMSAAANIFVGQTEAPLVIRPYLGKMTQSELFAVMTGGLASVAGSVLAGYAMMGVPLKYLLAASFMAAPAGLVMAKIVMPETEPEAKASLDVRIDDDTVNVIDAAAKGARDGMKLAINIAAMLIAFISLIALLNGILSLFGNITMEQILGYVFAPVSWAIGVPWNEAQTAGGFIGQKVVVNEFVAYSAFAPKMGELSEKTNVIVSFALCGFANLGSLAILIGGLGGLVPERRGDIARLGLRSVAAGVLASLLSAAIAGMLS